MGTWNLQPNFMCEVKNFPCILFPHVITHSTLLHVKGIMSMWTVQTSCISSGADTHTHTIQQLSLSSIFNPRLFIHIWSYLSPHVLLHGMLTGRGWGDWRGRNVWTIHSEAATGHWAHFNDFTGEFTTRMYHTCITPENIECKKVIFPCDFFHTCCGQHIWPDTWCCLIIAAVTSSSSSW